MSSIDSIHERSRTATYESLKGNSEEIAEGVRFKLSSVQNREFMIYKRIYKDGLRKLQHESDRVFTDIGTNVLKPFPQENGLIIGPQRVQNTQVKELFKLRRAYSCGFPVYILDNELLRLKCSLAMSVLEYPPSQEFAKKQGFLLACHQLKKAPDFYLAGGGDRIFSQVKEKAKDEAVKEIRREQTVGRIFTALLGIHLGIVKPDPNESRPGSPGLD